jgi:hypothetical protein
LFYKTIGKETVISVEGIIGQQGAGGRDFLNL